MNLLECSAFSDSFCRDKTLANFTFCLPPGLESDGKLLSFIVLDLLGDTSVLVEGVASGKEEA